LTAERRRVVEIVVEEAKGRVPAYGGEGREKLRALLQDLGVL